MEQRMATVAPKKAMLPHTRSRSVRIAACGATHAHASAERRGPKNALYTYSRGWHVNGRGTERR